MISSGAAAENFAQPMRAMKRRRSSTPQPAKEAANETDLEGANAGTINGLYDMAKPPENLG
jgi:hypothetical protein